MSWQGCSSLWGIGLVALGGQLSYRLVGGLLVLAAVILALRVRSLGLSVNSDEVSYATHNRTTKWSKTQMTSVSVDRSSGLAVPVVQLADGRTVRLEALGGRSADEVVRVLNG